LSKALEYLQTFGHLFLSVFVCLFVFGYQTKGYCSFFWVTYIPKSNTKSQPTNQPASKIENRQHIGFFCPTKTNLAPKPKIRGKILQSWN